MTSDCCVFKFLRSIVDGQHLMRFQSETYVFEFLRRNKGKVKSAYETTAAHQAGAYPGFCSMKLLGVFLLPPGCDASPSQSYPQH